MTTSLNRYTLIFLTLIICNTGFSFENPVWGTAQIASLRTNQFKFQRNNTIPYNQDAVHESLFEVAARGQMVLGYDRARQALLGRVYLEKDRAGNFIIRDVYCLKSFSNNDFGKKEGIGPDRIPSSYVLNTEHTWPQSRFTHSFPAEMQKSDLHHLFPADTEMNSKRGNLKFAEFANGQTIPIKCSTSRLAKTSLGLRFEPPMEHRGNVARALFYFSVRYKIHIDNDEEVFLRKWHQQDPVDRAEVIHHEMIFRLQGNRNPFIDRPDVVSQVADF